MDPIAELAEFDRETVAQAKAVEQRIQDEGSCSRAHHPRRARLPSANALGWNQALGRLGREVLPLPSSRPIRAWSALPKVPMRTPKN